MIRPDGEPLQDRVEVEETLIGGARPGIRPGRGKKRPLGRLRLAAIPDASAASLEGFLAADTARPLTVTTDGWAGYRSLAAEGYRHESINLSANWGDASSRLPAIHLVFSSVRGCGGPAPHSNAKR